MQRFSSSTLAKKIFGDHDYNHMKLPQQTTEDDDTKYLSIA
jgi:hypothetical protein